MGETDRDINNYSILQKKLLPWERYKSSAVGARRDWEMFPQESGIKGWAGLALSGSTGKGAPD